jgi:hypothetical protein
MRALSFFRTFRIFQKLPKQFDYVGATWSEDRNDGGSQSKFGKHGTGQGGRSII